MTRTMLGTPDPDKQPTPQRQRLSRKRNSNTFEFRVADIKGFVHVGEYDDGRPGEIFIKISKQGSTLAGVMSDFAIAISTALQYGVPLKALVEQFVGNRYEPAGMTDDPDIRFTSSIIDYIFRRLALDYLPKEERADLGILSISERTVVQIRPLEISEGPRPTSVPRSLDAPVCSTCGFQMQRAGSCFACPSCGSTSGCS